MHMLLENKISIITGANRGIGAEILKTFLEHGSHVIACVRKESPEFLDKINDYKKKYKKEIFPAYFDLENEKEIINALKTIKSLEHIPEIMINNAGIASGSLFQMTSSLQLKKEMQINFFSQLHFMQGIVKLMIRNKCGSIINIASVSGIDGLPGTLSYGSSKAAIIYATKVISREVGRYNIRVNSIAPGPIVTDMLGNMDEKAKNKMIESSALNRLGKPIDVANLSLFLASDLSSYITGQTIRVDGGMV